MASKRREGVAMSQSNHPLKGILFNPSPKKSHGKESDYNFVAPADLHDCRIAFALTKL
jgi:hypothetical protein